MRTNFPKGGDDVLIGEAFAAYSGVVLASGLRSVPWNGGGNSVDMVFEGRVADAVVGHHVDEEGKRGVLKVGTQACCRNGLYTNTLLISLKYLYKVFEMR